jgi:hypothetical protein
MARICEDVIIGYSTDDEGNETPNYTQYCYETGENDTSPDSNPITDDVDYTKIYDWNVNGDGSKQKLNPDGSIGYQDPDGSTYSVKNGIYTTESEGKTWRFDSKQNGFVDEAGKLISNAPSNLFTKMLNAVKANPLAALGTAYGAIKALGGSKDGGYNVPVPKLDAVREQIQYNDPNRRPGESGRQYFTDPRYAKEGDTAAITAAQNASAGQAQGILAAYNPAAAPATNPWAGKMKQNWNPPAATTGATTGTAANTVTATPPATGIAAALPVMPTQKQLMDPNYKIPMAAGGIANPRYLQGATDGMGDQIPSSIDGNQKAALSHGEFVIPADVVSHLGNGNSDAGAEKLYQMMARIRKARTGNEKQGKRINPDKFMPGGLAAAYAAGGEVRGFDGTTGSSVTGVPLDTSKTSSLSPWAGDYITNFLGQGAALAKAPMQTYGGPLTAGASDLQNQGFAGLSETAAAGYQPGNFTNQFTNPGAYKPTTSSFDTAAANQYMNPYLQASLNPQIDEARRQSLITQQQNAGKLTQAGAYGGGRQAIMDAETQRSLGANLASITGAGYNKAYDSATAQFNADQARKMAENQFGATQGMTGAQNTAQYGQQAQAANEASRQYSADYGLKSLSDLMKAGETQRGITSEGIAADKAQFEQQQAHPFNMVEFQRKLVEGLPTGATTTSTNQDALSKLQTDVSGLASLYKTLANLGVPPAP